MEEPIPELKWNRAHTRVLQPMEWKMLRSMQ